MSRRITFFSPKRHKKKRRKITSLYKKSTESGTRTRTGEMPKGFSYYSCFYANHLRLISLRCCSLDYFLTILLNINNLGPTYIVSTPFINFVEFREPSPKPIFL